jgi:hypothetical protein
MHHTQYRASIIRRCRMMSELMLEKNVPECIVVRQAEMILESTREYYAAQKHTAEVMKGYEEVVNVR